VVEAELLRLDSRLPDLDDPERDEVARTVRRVVDKLLHAPTVRVKQLAVTPGGDSYAAALRELFELSPGTAEAVAKPSELSASGLAQFGLGVADGLVAGEDPRARRFTVADDASVQNEADDEGEESR